jgi:hypothetical protein
MRTSTAVYPETTQAQQLGDADLTMVDLSSPPADMILVPGGTMNIVVPPGLWLIVNHVFYARKFVRIAGTIAPPLPPTPPNALFFRNDTGQGSFTKVVSLQTQLRPDGSFEAQIDKVRYPNLFPGFFVVGIRNPKANPTIRIRTIAGMAE